MTTTTELSSLPVRQNGGATSPARKQSALAAMASRMAIEPARLMEVLKNTVIRPTDKYTPSDEEVAAFIVVANQYDLNPFVKEIYAFADPRKGIVPIVGIDGWAKLINREPRFDGCDFDTVNLDGDIGMTCTMHVKDRAHPIKVTEWLKECQRPTDPWRGMPKRMLRHKAYMQAARIAFSISGIYDEDEARDIIATPPNQQPEEPGVSRTQSVLNKAQSRQSAQQSGTPLGDVAQQTESPPEGEEVNDDKANGDVQTNPPQTFSDQCWLIAEDMKYDADHFNAAFAAAMKLADKDKKTKEPTAPARAKILKAIMDRTDGFAAPQPSEKQ